MGLKLTRVGEAVAEAAIPGDDSAESAPVVLFDEFDQTTAMLAGAVLLMALLVVFFSCRLCRRLLAPYDAKKSA
jgi:hypothetical protein